MTYTYNRKGITRKVLSEIVRGLGAKDELKILKWQIRIIMEADAVYPYIVYMPKGCPFFCISDSAPASTERQWQRENARGMSARRVITMSVLFRHIYKSNRTPCPRKSLGWGVVAGSCWIVLKTAVKRDAVLCGATCRKIFVFPTYESVACSITTQLLTLT